MVVLPPLLGLVKGQTVCTSWHSFGWTLGLAEELLGLELAAMGLAGHRTWADLAAAWPQAWASLAEAWLQTLAVPPALASASPRAMALAFARASLALAEPVASCSSRECAAATS